MNHPKKVVALGLLSGGLDSTLAVKLILDQGVRVATVKLTSPFYPSNQTEQCHAEKVAKRFNVTLQVFHSDEDYIEILRRPKYGYGSGMNPCIDCRIYMLNKAKIYAEKMKADFIFTGEVLDERPMSQHWKAMSIIEKEAGLEGRILRPLSAKLLPETEAEIKGWVDRSKLLDIRGRSRKRQIELAKEFNITDYPFPAGGCLLTCREFANKVEDLVNHKNTIDTNDILLLRVGRHFRLGESKIIVGRNETENIRLRTLKRKDDYLFEVPGCGSPLTLLQDTKSTEAKKAAAALTVRYSDSRESKVRVNYGPEGLNDWIIVPPLREELIDKLRI